MDDTNEPILDPPVVGVHSSLEFDKASSDGEVYIPDCHRIARLLRILRELDESVAGLEALQEAELSDLVCRAIQEAGFMDPGEARYAIAAVLEVIGPRTPVIGNSWSC
jgi:hypothetical protein